MKHLAILILFSTLCLVNGCDSKPTLLPLTTEGRILAFGDSLTFGTGTNKENAYPAILEKRIGHQVINAGIPGEISARGLQRLPHLLTRHQPELIVICHGANDILRKLDLEKAKNNIQKMIDLAQSQGVQVVLIAVPTFSLFLTPHELYGDLASDNNIPIVNDTLSLILGNNQLKSDQIHPNKEGYRVLANAIYKKISVSGGS